MTPGGFQYIQGAGQFTASEGLAGFLSLDVRRHINDNVPAAAGMWTARNAVRQHINSGLSKSQSVIRARRVYFQEGRL